MKTGLRLVAFGLAVQVGIVIGVGWWPVLPFMLVALVSVALVLILAPDPQEPSHEDHPVHRRDPQR